MKLNYMPIVLMTMKLIILTRLMINKLIYPNKIMILWIFQHINYKNKIIIRKLKKKEKEDHIKKKIKNSIFYYLFFRNDNKEEIKD